MLVFMRLLLMFVVLSIIDIRDNVTIVTQSPDLLSKVATDSNHPSLPLAFIWLSVSNLWRILIALLTIVIMSSNNSIVIINHLVYCLIYSKHTCTSFWAVRVLENTVHVFPSLHESENGLSNIAINTVSMTVSKTVDTLSNTNTRVYQGLMPTVLMQQHE